MRRMLRSGGIWLLLMGLLLIGMASTVAAQPGPALQARLDRATPGDTVWVPAGTHPGPLVIRTPRVVLRGRPGARIDGTGAGHVLVIAAPGVTVENLTLVHSGRQLADDHAGLMVRAPRATVRNNRFRNVLHGIYVQGVGDVQIVANRIEGVGRDADPPPPAQRGNGIHLWKSVGNVIRRNVITGTRDGVYFSFADSTQVVDNRIHDVRYGLHYMYSDANTVRRNVFTDNAAGSALMYSSGFTVQGNTFRANRGHRGYGLLLQTVDGARFIGNRLVQNGIGLYLENSTRNLFRKNTLVANHRGLRLTGSSMDNRFTQNIFQGNLQTVMLAGVSATNTWHVGGRGNYWGPRGLVDLNGDGVSEVPHHALDVLAARREAFPYVDLLTGSPGLDLMAYALQQVAPTSVAAITDRHALMHPPPRRIAQTEDDTIRATAPRGARLAGGLIRLLFTGSLLIGSGLLLRRRTS